MWIIWRSRTDVRVGLGLVCVLLMGLFLGCDQKEFTEANGDEEPATVPQTLGLSGDLQDVHDPAVIQAHGRYYLYSTGGGIQWRSSADRGHWQWRGVVLDGVPPWADDIAEDDLWAPDIAYFNGRYHLYYSASTFGSGRSAIGVATSPVLSPDRAGYEWTDRGKVIESHPDSSYNAIDPNIVIDEERVWMAFGSWNETGIRMRRLDPSTGKPSAEDDSLYLLANRPNADENAVEAPYIIRHDGAYYLFLSFDHCCDGADSDYNIRVGRSTSVTGPYEDRQGRSLTEGGGTLLLDGWSEWSGPGHNAVLQDDDGSFLVYHAYSPESGTPHLRISPLEWEDGWPVVPVTERS